MTNPVRFMTNPCLTNSFSLSYKVKTEFGELRKHIDQLGLRKETDFDLIEKPNHEIDEDKVRQIVETATENRTPRTNDQNVTVKNSDAEKHHLELDVPIKSPPNIYLSIANNENTAMGAPKVRPQRVRCPPFR